MPVKPVLKILTGVALLTASAGASGKDKAKAPPEWDMIAFEMKSWGRPIHSWTIMSEGSGSFVIAKDKQGANYSQYSLEFREVEAGKKGYTELRQLLAKLPDPAPDYDMCTNRMTDMPYGTIRLTKAATTIEIRWNSGCMDDKYVAFLDILKAADQKVEGWGTAGKILRTEEVGSPAN